MENKIKVANAPCSWGVLEFDLEGESLGYEQVLDEIKVTGYSGTELGDWGFMPTDPDKLKGEIAIRNLDLLGAFVPVALANPSKHEEGVERALKTANLMYQAGYRNAFIILADDNGTVDYRTKHAGRIKKSEGLSDEQMQVFCKGAERIALAVKDRFDIRTVFHHHCAGYIETQDEIETFLNKTDSNIIGLCFDTGHYQFGGGKNPVDFMDKNWDRIWHVHFKDFASQVREKAIKNEWDYFQSVHHGVFCELGKGDVDFAAIRKLLRERNYNGWIVVEQDVLPGMGNPRQCAENNRLYLQTIDL